eukprot:TRINITY_DN19679_c0_g1_i2.p1 TRINITY_DN19679_c0_g1~~TRINITY_DN19679_c0_g1_i2.p1  ORF type:complete len:365 (-),score=39.34 TRINITY_DN19679_c0_g1_i2:131-1225(-)
MPGHTIVANPFQPGLMSGHSMAVQPIQPRVLAGNAPVAHMMRSPRNDSPVAPSLMSSQSVMVGVNASPMMSEHSVVANPARSPQVQSSGMTGRVSLAKPMQSLENRSLMMSGPAAPAKSLKSPAMSHHALASRSVAGHSTGVPQSTATMVSSMSSDAALHMQRRSPETECRVIGERSITREELLRTGYLVVAGASDTSPPDITPHIMHRHALPQSQLEDTIRVPTDYTMVREDPFLPGCWIELNRHAPMHPTIHAAHPSGNDTEALFPETALMHPAAAAALAAEGSHFCEESPETLIQVFSGDFLDVFRTHGIVVDKDDLAPHAESDFWQSDPKPLLSLPRFDDNSDALDNSAFRRCWPEQSER